VPRLPGSESGACRVDAHSPRSLPFAPPTPQRIAPRCGMFAIYVCLRPALGTVDPPQRLRLMRVTFQKFFLWVWVAILLLLASGYWIVFMRVGGFAGAGLHIHLMQIP
jgi:hypothetical protein